MERPENIPAELYLEFYTDAVEKSAEATEALMNAGEGNGTPEDINGAFRAIHTIKGSAMFLELEDFYLLSLACEDKLDSMRQTGSCGSIGVLDILLSAVACIQAMAVSAAEYLNRTGSLIAARDVGDVVMRLRSAAAAEQEEISADRPAEQDGSGPEAAELSQDVKVPRVRLEAVIAYLEGVKQAEEELKKSAALLAFAHPVKRAAFEKKTADISRAVARAYAAAGQLNMSPLRHQFMRLRSMAGELCRRSGKEAAVMVSGGSLEVDRLVEEKIGTPLMHIIRNAVDHGIEPAAQRAAAGKKPSATIMIAAEQSRGVTKISVSDDGRGIDREKVLAKARAMGLEGIDAGGRDPLDLIFIPGLSTAEHITQLSGRGVGMDTVMQFTRETGSSVEVDSEPGRGTTVTISLPHVMSLLNVLVFTRGGFVSAMPLSSVGSVFSATGRASGDGRITTKDGRFCPVYDGVFTGEKGGASEIGPMAVEIMAGGQSACLYCDSALTRYGMKSRGLAGLKMAASMFTGFVMLEDGILAPIYDPVKVVGSANGKDVINRYETQY
ncbi:MAG: Hpt domain-containing protein [Spirochaetia bacterium]|nr:Hpt domain-containing protein [Spirochaetia bacterium]